MSRRAKPELYVDAWSFEEESRSVRRGEFMYSVSRSVCSVRCDGVLRAGRLVPTVVVHRQGTVYHGRWCGR